MLVLHQACHDSISACRCRESAHVHVDNNLPFELKVLEAALTHAVTMMEEDAIALNKQVSPILDSLAYKVLERYMSFACVLAPVRRVTLLLLLGSVCTVQDIALYICNINTLP